MAPGTSDPFSDAETIRPVPPHDDAAAELERGALVGRYLVLGRVGEGAMGTVFAAHDPRLDRRLALKVLKPDAAGAQSHAQFLREAQAMARLAHPNVVTVHDAGEVCGVLHIAMEFVDGVTLRRWLQGGTRSWREVLALFLQAGRGLAAAHAAGILHRDFKPENVLIDAAGRVRVADFGLARPLVRGATADRDASDAGQASTDLGGLTLTGAVQGTPRYMAPEQFLGKPADARTDQFAFCVALYEALYREPPFAGDTVEALAASVVAGRVRPPPAGAKVPRFLRKTLLQGLAADPDARFASMEVLLSALARNRSTAWRRWMVASVVAGLAATNGLVFWSAQHPAGEVCGGGEGLMQGVWDERERPAVQRAFLATAAPYAPDVWRTVERTLNTYAQDWVRMHREACEATRVHRSQSEALLDLRMQCLEQRRIELRALTQVLAGADVGVVREAVSGVTGLKPASTCTDPASLAAFSELPRESAARGRLGEVRTMTAEANSLSLLGRPVESEERARQAVEAARGLNEPATLANALLSLGRAQWSRNRWTEAEATLTEVIPPAIQGRDPEALAAALQHLAIARVDQSARVADGVILAQWARAIVAGLGPGHTEIELRQFWAEASLADARADFVEEARLDEAALALADRSLGPEHKMTSRALIELGRDRATAGEWDQALSMERRATSVLERVIGPAHPETASALQSQAKVLIGWGRPGEALPLLERAAVSITAALGTENSDVAGVRTDQASALVRTGRTDEALRMAQLARETLERAGSSREPPMAEALSVLAEVHLERGEHGAALRAARRAATLYAELMASELPYRAQPLLAEARTLLALRRPRAALAAAEEALQILEKAKVYPDQMAGAQFTVARALTATGGSRARARSLARTALETYGRWGAGWEHQTAQIQAWLDRNGGR